MDNGKKKKFKFYDSYIVSVLKTIGNIGITSDGRNQMNSCMIHISKYISDIALGLIISNGKKTLSHEEITNALKIVFIDNDNTFTDNMFSECEQSLFKFRNSDKNVSRQKKAGIIFAPSVVEKFLRNFNYNKVMISSEAPVYLAVALEFICMNMLFRTMEKLQNI